MSLLDGLTRNTSRPLDTVEWILRVTVLTLALIMVVVICTLMAGLFIADVDNSEVFSVVGPAFNTIVGAFVGLLGGLSLNNVNGKPDGLAPEPDEKEAAQ
jgi:hypothetical protein